MSGTPLASPAPTPGEVIYPASDGEPMETGIHVLLMVTMISTLRYHFRQRPDVYVIGNIFLFYEEGNPAARRSPDLMVVKGVEANEHRRSFFTWQEKAVPAVVMEFTSGKTADEDMGPKKELYEKLGVREYFLFDPLHDYLPQQLMGYLLIGGRYEPLMPGADGSLLSQELGMRLVPDGEQLGLVYFKTGERILPPPEALEQQQRRVEELLKQAAEERRRSEGAAKEAEQARKQVVEERRRSEEAGRKADEERRRSEEASRLAAEARYRAEDAEKQVAEARHRAEEAHKQIAEERRRAEEAQKQAAALAEELARLKAQLQPPGDQP